MAHHLFTTGEFEITDGPNQYKGSLAQLHGMFGHIDRVDWYNATLSPNEPHEEPRGIGSKENLYRRFLLFKEFYMAASPTLICEGKTDNVYLKCAIRRLATRYPALASVAPNGATTIKVRIFKYPNTSTGRILKLRGGSGDLKNLITLYKKEMVKFKAPGQFNPVILLVDSDEGAKQIIALVAQITRTYLINGS
jgi:hypothetical protein